MTSNKSRYRSGIFRTSAGIFPERENGDTPEDRTCVACKAHGYPGKVYPVKSGGIFVCDLCMALVERDARFFTFALSLIPGFMFISMGISFFNPEMGRSEGPGGFILTWEPFYGMGGTVFGIILGILFIIWGLAIVLAGLSPFFRQEKFKRNALSQGFRQTVIERLHKQVEHERKMRDFKPAQKECPKCGELNRLDAHYCLACGEKLR